MIRGLSALRASWSIPSRAVVPNEKLSTTTSDGPGELIELLPALDALQIDAGTALTPIPHPIPGLLRKWIAQGRLDTHDVSPVVGKEHRGHRAGHTPGQVENAQIARMLQPYDSTPSHSGGSTIALTMSEESPFSRGVPIAHRSPAGRRPGARPGSMANGRRPQSRHGGSHLTATREYRRVGHHRMSNQLLPPGAVDCRVNDARSSSEPKDSSLDEQHANRRRPEKLH